jgi:hypothetical protein
MELATIIGAITPLKSLLDFISSNKEKDEARYEDALVTLYTALNETRIYIGELEQDKGRRNRDTEGKLSRLWTVAATKIRRIDRSWAVICFQKGDYWANPDNWTDADVKRAGIEINEVFEKAQELL